MTVRLWDVATGWQVGVLTGHEHLARSVSFHPSGQELASASNDKTVRLWDLTRWRGGSVNPPVQVLRCYDVFTQISWRADGGLLTCAGSMDGTIGLCDATATPPRLHVIRLFPPGTPFVTGAALTPEGRYVATGNPDGTIHVLRLANLGEVFQVPASNPVISEEPKLKQAKPAPRERMPPGKGPGLTEARGGQWEKAAALFKRRMELDPEEHWNWYACAPLYLQTGDVENYRQLCRAMLERFGKTDQPRIAERIVKTCSLAPAAVSNFGQVLKLADLAGTGSEQQASYRYFLLAKGMAEFRAGNHTRAVEWLERFDRIPDSVSYTATAFAVLAMAQHQSGHGEEARAALAKARAIIVQKMPNLDKGQRFNWDWLDWLHTQILFREAESLLKGPGSSQPNSKEN